MFKIMSFKGRIYTVYDIRTVDYPNQSYTQFLIYDDCAAVHPWKWVNSNDYVPMVEE